MPEKCPQIHAPYHFVPLSSFIFQPEWKNEVTHDIPFKAGLCGVLEINITAYTPILVGEKQGNRVYPYRLPNGEYAIPGSSLHGMIRNVLEIATFGKMRIVDDKRYGVRDLSAGFYKNDLTTEIANKEYEPNSKTGFLNFTRGQWEITPCDHARVDHKVLEKQLRHTKFKGLDVKQKVNTWLEQKSELALTFQDANVAAHNHDKTLKDGKTRRLTLRYRKITDLTGGTDGTLVFTGTMSNKHMEFIFYAQKPSAVRIVPESVMQGFLHIYDDSAHWRCLNELKRNGSLPHGIPVFYLEKAGNIASLGLSQMYKLAYEHSIAAMIAHTSDAHGKNNHPDLAQLMFGVLDEEDGKQSLQGRISFSTAVCKQKQGSLTTSSHQTILNSPKPTYYPSYVRQDEQHGKLDGSDYKTYMDDDGEIRGWKRYPVRNQVTIPSLNAEQARNKDIQVNLNPIDVTTDPPIAFTGKVRFHNLKPEELGALRWALTWGGDEVLRHNIGMGKPFGLGQIGITITHANIIPNDVSAKTTPDLDRCQQAFEDMLEMACQEHPFGWALSDQLLCLTAMATPKLAEGKVLKHMDLACFADAKKKPKKVLKDYIDIDKVREEKEKRIEAKNQAAEASRQAAENEANAAQAEIQKQADKQAFLDTVADQEIGERLYAVRDDIAVFAETPVSAIQAKITPTMRKLFTECVDWSSTDQRKLVEIAMKAVEAKGLYQNKQRKKIKSKIEALSKTIEGQ